MKGSFTFLMILIVAFMSIVAKNAPEVDLLVPTPTPTSRTAGTHSGDSAPNPTPEPTPTAIPISLPQHIWPPTLGTSYENGELGGIGDRFDITEAQIFVVFAYKNMEDGLPCAIALFRGGEANGEMPWLWDTKLRPSQGSMVIDIMSIIENLQPGDYAVEFTVSAQIEQRVKFELF